MLKRFPAENPDWVRTCRYLMLARSLARDDDRMYFQGQLAPADVLVTRYHEQLGFGAQWCVCVTKATVSRCHNDLLSRSSFYSLRYCPFLVALSRHKAWDPRRLRSMSIAIHYSPPQLRRPSLPSASREEMRHINHTKDRSPTADPWILACSPILSFLLIFAILPALTDAYPMTEARRLRRNDARRGDRTAGQMPRQGAPDASAARAQRGVP
jgi:hypothetical protein